MTHPARAGRPVAAALTAIALVGCLESGQPQRKPEAPDDGIQATGLVGGQRIAIARGEPAVFLGDCDPASRPDRDLCIGSRTIDGVEFELVIGNPDVLEAGTTVEVGDHDCRTCEDVTGQAVVDLDIGDRRLRALSGRLQVREDGPRYAASFDLRFPSNDRLTGSFNVRPRRAP